MTDELKIDTPKQLEAWFSERQSEIAIAIASRCALRALPLIASELTVDQSSFLGFLADAFSCCALAYCASRYSHRSRSLVDHRDALREGTPAAVYACLAGSQAVNAALNPEFAAGTAAGAAKFSAIAAGATNEFEGREILWTTVLIDAERSASPNFDVRSLSSRRLWQSEMPSWVDSQYSTVRSFLASRDDWDVWIDWYEDRLAGRVHSEEYELVFASVPNELWDQGPAAANRWIKEHLPKEEPPPTEKELFAQLAQDPHGATIEFHDHRARIVPAIRGDDAEIARTPQAVQAHQQTRRRAAAARDFARRLSNQHGFENISRTVEDFALLVEGDTEQVAGSICVLWEMWTAIGTFIERDDAVREGRGGLATAMDADVREALSQLWITSATFITRFPTAKENERLVREAKQSRADIEAPKRIASSASKAHVLDEELERFLDDAAAAAERSDGPQAEKARFGLVVSVRNVLVAFMLATACIGCWAAKTVGEEALKDVYNNSETRQLFREWVVSIEEDGARLFKDLPNGYQAAWREFCRRWRGFGSRQ